MITGTLPKAHTACSLSEVAQTSNHGCDPCVETISYLNVLTAANISCSYFNKKSNQLQHNIFIGFRGYNNNVADSPLVESKTTLIVELKEASSICIRRPCIRSCDIGTSVQSRIWWYQFEKFTYVAPQEQEVLPQEVALTGVGTVWRNKFSKTRSGKYEHV